MTPEEQILWQKIKAFPLDDPGSSFPFSDRLARENGWSKAYARRVVEEYKKFLFLCCVTTNGVTPSDPVDQAWHLHLTYTHSYWTDLCKNTLGQDIHHNPTKGGSGEAKKFSCFYTTTHDLYREKFGSPPPPDIWHDHHTRFTDIDFRRVNVNRNLIIKKPAIPKKQVVILSGCMLFALLSIQAIVWDAPTFIFLAVLAVICVAAYRNRGKGGDASGCSTAGCNSDVSHYGDSGCSSGCSGCSGSGCSGCGGGGD